MCQRAAALLLVAAVCCQVLQTQADCPTPPATSLLKHVIWNGTTGCGQIAEVEGTICSGACTGTDAPSASPTAICQNDTWALFNTNTEACYSGCRSGPTPADSSHTFGIQCTPTGGSTQPNGFVCRTYTCNSGLVPSAIEPTSVCVDGDFNSSGSCMAGCLNAPSTAAAVDWGSCSSNTSIASADGTQCTATCTAGYTAGLDGAPNATCNGTTGIWTLGSGGCFKSCSNPPDCATSYLIDWGSCKTGTTAYLGQCNSTCSLGSVGDPETPVAVCDADGKWKSFNGGQCLKNCTNPPPASLTSTNVSWSSCSTGYTADASSCTGTCPAGTTKSIPINPSAYCQQGNWKIGIDSCSPNPCQNPAPTLTNVTWASACTAQGNTTSGSSCTGTCASGTVVTGGTPKVTCSYGNWSLTGGTCQVPASPCSTPPNSTFLKNTVWSCSSTASGGTCTGSCVNGTADPINGFPVATCSNGKWNYTSGACTACLASQLPSLSNSSTFTWPSSCTAATVSAQNVECVGVCKTGYTSTFFETPRTLCSGGLWQAVTGQCVPQGCPGVPPSNLTNNTSWGSCPALGSLHNATCTGSCNTGFVANITAGGLPVARCNLGVWKLEQGACIDIHTAQSSSACNSSGLPLANESFNWSGRCTAVPALLNGTVCIGNCSMAYAVGSGSSLPSTRCNNGSWTSVIGACQPQGCTGNPGLEVSPNTTWNCPVTTPHLGNCTGTCNSSSSSANAGPPIAVCLFGQWGYTGGSCTGGGKTRFYTVQGPQELIDRILAQVAAGVAFELINQELANYQSILQQRYPALAGMTDVQLANFFIAATAPVASNRRKLSAAGSATVTVGFQMKSADSGLYNFAQEKVLDLLTTSPAVVPAVTSWAIGAAVKTNVLPASFNFSGVTVGPSDAAGDYVKPPVMTEAAACFIAFQTNSSLAGVQAPSHQLYTTPTLCPDANTFSASFPYQLSGAVTGVSFEASAVNIAGAGGVDHNVSCAVSTGGSAPNTTAQVSCTRITSAPFPPGALYKILLTANYTCGDPKALRAFSSSDLKIQDVPHITILQQGPARPLVCWDAGQVTVEYNYTVMGDISIGQVAVSGAASSSVHGVNCSVKLSEGAGTMINAQLVSIGTATVTCKGPLQAPSNMDVNLVLTVKPQNCAATTAAATTRVSFTCCKQGRSYARQQKVGQNKAKCFSHYLPGTTDSECSKSSPVYGIYNQGPASAKLSFFDDNTKKCATRASVGTAVMSCDSSSKKLVHFTMQSSNTDLKADQQFLLTCAPPSTQPGKCPGESRWYKVSLKKYKASIRLAGRTKITTFDASLPAKAECDCQDAVWAVYESGVFTGLPAKQFC